ncbi:hypothetical protein Sjap_020839 [Stephania japonica]|uniref:3-beta hydroxysteroid dehydrogenase/isomerase domain-containing protein n=1 Tax=Stephania japonica TaxID=461633 RepID=A0AAP0F1H1_9MAGN
MEGEKGPVCVTGGAGFLASWLIMRLLQCGYSVHATFRSDPSDFSFKYNPLLSLPEASGKLKFFEADLGNPESFDAAINGCVGVFHVAHPMNLEDKIDQDTIVKISLEGALGILKLCSKSKSVKRVIYTSSIAAVLWISNRNNVQEITESSWSEVDCFRSFKAPEISYVLSKTITERAALEFAEKHELNVVTLLPAAILGPFLGSDVPDAFSFALPLIFGTEAICALMKDANMVHIDNAVSAQIFLFECPNAKGRYICSSNDVSIDEVAKYLSIKYSELQMSTKSLGQMEGKKPLHLSSKKLLDLGFTFKYSLEEMIDGAIQCSKEKGLL